ncbi:MAG: lysylphosphatidylglycerol synthase domain-containing protein [Gemmatimonadaceae bacterium]
MTSHIMAVMKPTTTSTARRFFLFAGVGALVVVIARSHPRELLVTLRAAGWAVPAIVAVYGIVYLMNTIAWRLTMTDGTRLQFGRAAAINVAAFSMNYLTPFASIGGEPFKIITAAKWMGTTEATASVLSYRLVHIQAHLMVFLTGLALAIAVLPRNVFPWPALLLLGVALSLLTLLVLVVQREGMLERLFRVLRRMPLVGGLVARLDPQRESFIEIDRQLSAFQRTNRGRYFGALFFEYAARVFSMLEFLIIARAAGYPVTFATAFIIGSFSSLVVNLLFFIPFNAGSKEGSLVLIFSALGLPIALGAAAAVLSRIRELIWIAIGLGLALVVRPPVQRVSK